MGNKHSPLIKIYARVLVVMAETDQFNFLKTWNCYRMKSTSECLLFYPQENLNNRH